MSMPAYPIEMAIMQAFLPLLGADQSRTGSPGRIIFVGSIYGSWATVLPQLLLGLSC